MDNSSTFLVARPPSLVPLHSSHEVCVMCVTCIMFSSCLLRERESVTETSKNFVPKEHGAHKNYCLPLTDIVS